MHTYLHTHTNKQTTRQPAMHRIGRQSTRRSSVSSNLAPCSLVMSGVSLTSTRKVTKAYSPKSKPKTLFACCQWCLIYIYIYTYIYSIHICVYISIHPLSRTHTLTHTHTRTHAHTHTHTHTRTCTHIGNVHHEWIKKKIEEGDGLPDMLHTSGVDKAIKSSGFEIVYSRDMALDPQQAVSWYVCMCVCVCVCVCVYNIYVCIYVYIYVCVYILCIYFI